MARVKSECQARLVYNRTERRVTCYNDEGSFVELMPAKEKPLPEYKFGIEYIVSSREYQEIKNSGRTTRDLCYMIDRLERGRGGIPIAYLESYDERAGERRIRIVPSSIRSYKKSDPGENIHHFLTV